MLKICVCIGNACQLKGSYQILCAFEELIKINHLEDRVELSEAYCMGHCRRGVSVKIGDQYIVDCNILNIEANFKEYVLNSL